MMKTPKNKSRMNLLLNIDTEQYLNPMSHSISKTNCNGLKRPKHFVKSKQGGILKSTSKYANIPTSTEVSEHDEHPLFQINSDLNKWPLVHFHKNFLQSRRRRSKMNYGAILFDNNSPPGNLWPNSLMGINYDKLWNKSSLKNVSQTKKNVPAKLTRRNLNNKECVS